MVKKKTCIFISGQNKLQETSNYTGIPIRSYGQQEANIIPIVKPITKYATMITDSKNIVYEFLSVLIPILTNFYFNPIKSVLNIRLNNIMINCRSKNIHQ